MATPTPSSAPQKRPLAGPSTPATAGVSTPKGFATPTNGALGSIASPSTQRVTASPAKRGAQFAGKSPYSIGTPTKTPSGLSSKTIAGSSPTSNHPTGSSIGVNGAPMGFESPATLLGALGGAAMESGLSGGVGMGITMSSLGLTASALGRADDEERRRKLELVLQTLRRRPGFVSAEGLERLCKRCGLSFMEDVRADGKHILSMAGETFLLDVDVAPNRANSIERVALTFPSATAGVTKHAAKAAEILKEDLQPESRTATALVTLDKFANNLERLASLDKLSKSGTNCFEAISGIYASLKRLYEHEVEVVKVMVTSDQKENGLNPEQEVLCKKSGRPNMHAHGKLGLSLDYWISDHLLPENIETSIDENKTMEQRESTVQQDKPQLFSLIIECESSLATLYTPIRNSEEWVSEQVMKRPEENADHLDMQPDQTNVIDWLEPPPSLIATVEPNPQDAENGYSHGQSRASFVAKLDPPIALPFSVATQILNSVNVPTSQDPTRIAMYDLFVMPDNPTQTAMVSGEGNQRQIHLNRSLRAFNDKHDPHKEYIINVMFPKREAALKLEELPFEHPRQIIGVLPLLRQHAFIASLFQKSCHTSQSSMTFKIPTEAQSGTSRDVSKLSLESELDRLMDQKVFGGPRKLDVVFRSLPIPRFTMFQSREGENGKVTLAVLANAEVTVLDQNYVRKIPGKSASSDTVAQDHQAKKKIANLAEALIVAEDLVIWAEWTRRVYNIQDAPTPFPALS